MMLPNAMQPDCGGEWLLECGEQTGCVEIF